MARTAGQKATAHREACARYYHKHQEKLRLSARERMRSLRARRKEAQRKEDEHIQEVELAASVAIMAPAAPTIVEAVRQRQPVIHRKPVAQQPTKTPHSKQTGSNEARFSRITTKDVALYDGLTFTQYQARKQAWARGERWEADEDYWHTDSDSQPELPIATDDEDEEGDSDGFDDY